MIAVVVIGVIVAAVVYATSGRGGPTSSPTPSPSATPTQTPSPTPDPSAAKAAKDHADAEFALKAALAEEYRMIDNGETTATSKLKKYMGGAELDSIIAEMKDIRRQGYVGHGSPKIARIRFDTKYPDTSQKMRVCEEPNGFYSTDSSGKRVSSGVTLAYEVTMSLGGSQWRRTGSTDTKEIKSCRLM